MILVKIKNPDGRDTVGVAQLQFLADWPGETAIIRTLDEAAALIGVERAA